MLQMETFETCLLRLASKENEFESRPKTRKTRIIEQITLCYFSSKKQSVSSTFFRIFNSSKII